MLIRASCQIEYSYCDYMTVSEYVLLTNVSDKRAFELQVPRRLQDSNLLLDLEIVKEPAAAAITALIQKGLLQQSDLWLASDWKPEQKCCVCKAEFEEDRQAQCKMCFGYVCIDHALESCYGYDYCQNCLSLAQGEHDAKTSHKITKYFLKV